jgi:hypothetical protein
MYAKGYYKDAYSITKQSWRRELHAHVIGQFLLFLTERDYICPEVQ